MNVVGASLTRVLSESAIGWSELSMFQAVSASSNPLREVSRELFGNVNCCSACYGFSLPKRLSSLDPFHAVFDDTSKDCRAVPVTLDILPVPRFALAPAQLPYQLG